MNDIDCTGVTYRSIVGYSGTFDGRNHTISNVTASVPAPGGLFVTTNGGAIKNLKFTGFNITTAGGANTGALVGQSNGTTITNITGAGTVNGSNSAGGLIGVQVGGTLSNSSFTGNVSAISGGWGGGLVGVLMNGSITNSYSNATLTGSDGGGMIGTLHATDGNTVSVTNSYTLSNVNFGGGNNNRGGIVERIYNQTGSHVNLDNNIVAGNVHGGSAIYAYTYPGSDTDTISLTNNYIDADAVGSATSCVGGAPAVGCTAVNVIGTEPTYFQNTTAVAPLTSWNFTTIWQQTTGYPTLRTATVGPLANPTIPGSATNLQAVQGIPKSKAQLTWTAAPDGGSDVTYSILYRDITAGDASFTTYGTTTIDTAISVPNLTLHHEYQFEVRAANAIGTGGTSAPINLTMNSNNSSVITTCTQLQAIDDNLSGSYTLGSDIDCSQSATWNDGAGFSPIGLADGWGSYFNGSLNGQGHAINGLTINQGTANSAGLFLNVNGATLQNIVFNNPSISGLTTNGTLASNVNDTNVSNIVVNNGQVTSTVSFSSNTGGLMGTYTGDSGSYKMDYSSFTGSVSGGYNTGGLVGYTSFAGIETSFSSGTVSGSFNVGGLVGEFENFWGIANSYSNSTVAATNDNVGGLVGQLGDGLHGAPFIYRSYASGNVTANGDSVGGLVGLNFAPITVSFAAGAVSAPSATAVGGFIGTTYIDASSQNYYDQLRSGQSNAVGSGTFSDVIAVNTNVSPNNTYFFNNLTNSPLQYWDDEIWYTKASSYPVLTHLANNVANITTTPAPTTITATWPAASSDNTTDVTGYILKYRPNSQSSDWVTVNLPANTTSYAITGLVPDTRYDITVITRSDGVSSSGTTVTDKTLPLPIIKPITPKAVASGSTAGPVATAAATTTATDASQASAVSDSDNTHRGLLGAAGTPAGGSSMPAYAWALVGALAIAGVGFGTFMFLRHRG